MKHTDIFPKILGLHDQQIIELKNALQAHNCDYTWLDVSGDAEVSYEDYQAYRNGELELPCVVVMSYDDNLAYELVVCRAYVRYGRVVLLGFKDNSIDLDIIDCEAKEVLIGYLGYIIDAIPETPEVDDVSTGDEYPIAYLSREDLTKRGYDVSQVSDETMRELARRMGNAYCDNDFWVALSIIAGYLQIPKLK